MLKPSFFIFKPGKSWKHEMWNFSENNLTQPIANNKKNLKNNWGQKIPDFSNFLAKLDTGAQAAGQVGHFRISSFIVGDTDVIATNAFFNNFMTDSLQMKENQGHDFSK